LQRFDQEARVLAALNHPTCCHFRTGTHEGAPYLVSELLEGETLRETLANHSGLLPQRKAIEYALEIAQASPRSC